MLLYNLSPDDQQNRQSNRIDVQRARLLDQRRHYQAMEARQRIGHAPTRYRVRRPLLIVRHALGRALVNVGRQLAPDAPGETGGCTSTAYLQKTA